MFRFVCSEEDGLISADQSRETSLKPLQQPCQEIWWGPGVGQCYRNEIFLKSGLKNYLGYNGGKI